jgi:diaminopimelate decarboxylase
MMNPSLPNKIFREIADKFGTPAYVYDLAHIRARVRSLRESLRERFKISYAMKSNPNAALLSRMREFVDRLDISSGGELVRAADAGWSPDLIGFTGPGKRDTELQLAIDRQIGHVVLESTQEAQRLDKIAAVAGRVQRVLIRISPLALPPGFGSRMAGKPTQFGIDEEVVDGAIEQILRLKNLRLDGFHVYSGTQCLSAASIVEHFRSTLQLFGAVSQRYKLRPRTLVIGSGFGIPYHETDKALEIGALGSEIGALVEAFKQQPHVSDAELILETGRYLVGEAGYFLTSVVSTKTSRGVAICVCDGGMNHHLAASGHLGSVIHRNYPIFKVDDNPPPREHWQPQTLYGPLCTSIDLLGNQVALPPLAVGELLAFGSSGAYGLTSSPTGFISHPLPREILVDRDSVWESR